MIVLIQLPIRQETLTLYSCIKTSKKLDFEMLKIWVYEPTIK